MIDGCINKELLKAAKESHTDKVRSLVSQGADINTIEGDEYNRTALLHAIRGSHCEIVKFLLQNNADLLLKDKFGDGILQYTFLFQDHYDEQIRELIEKKGFILSGAYAAIFTADPIEKLNSLEERNVKLDVLDQFGYSIIHYSASHGILLVVQWICQKFPHLITIANKRNGYTSLLLAADRGRTTVVKWLLKYGGAKINEKSKTGETPLLLAAWNGHDETMMYLLEVGAKIDDKDKDGDTALILAAQQGHTNIVDLLLRHGLAKIDEKNNLNKTALILAKENNKKETLIFLQEWVKSHT